MDETRIRNSGSDIRRSSAFQHFDRVSVMVAEFWQSVVLSNYGYIGRVEAVGCGSRGGWVIKLFIHAICERRSVDFGDNWCI